MRPDQSAAPRAGLLSLALFGGELTDNNVAALHQSTTAVVGNSTQVIVVEPMSTPITEPWNYLWHIGPRKYAPTYPFSLERLLRAHEKKISEGVATAAATWDIYRCK